MEIGNKSNTNETSDTESVLPSLNKGELLQCTESKLVEKQTSAPKHFTEATILAAMTGISRYVQDSKIKLILKETDGLGTEATRASIIELLFKRQFMQKIGKERVETHPAKRAVWF